MAEVQSIYTNMKVSLVEETIEGTPVAETASSAVLLSNEGAEIDLTKESNENPFMTGSLSKSAPVPSMWTDSMGMTINTNLRGKGTLTYPDYHLLNKSIFGLEEINIDGVVDAGSTTTNIILKSGGTDLITGQLVYFPETSEISRVIDVSTPGEFDIDPPLNATPSEDDDIKAGINWMLASTGHPSMTGYTYYDGPKRVRQTGLKTTNAEFTFEVGAYVVANFTCTALDALQDYTAQSVTPTYDDETKPLTCLGVSMTTGYQCEATGTPTTTETILLTPDNEVAVGDKIAIDVGSGVWETVSISAVSGDAGSNITLTHAAVSAAASDGDTVKIYRNQCAGTGTSISLTIEATSEFELCMIPSGGKKGQKQVERMVTLTKDPYFDSWQEFYLRDNVISSTWMILLGDTENNIMAVFIPNKVNTEVSLTSDMLMKVDTTAGAYKDPVLGNDHEIVMAVF